MSQALASGAPRLQGPQLLAAALLLGLGNFMVVLDTTIANVSVPHIAGALAVSPSQGTWVITSYSVAEAITVPLTGWLVRRFGAVRLFVAAMLGFGFFSFACGLAPSFATLVAFRVMQGLCGGPLMPSTQTLMMSIFPREKAGQALGIWSMTTVVAPIAGPLLGGTISDSIGWSWIFFINIPVAIGVAIAAWALLKRYDAPGQRVRVDYIGLGLLVVWVGALELMLDKGKELEWFASPVIVALAVAGAIGFVSFLIWELTEADPIVDLRIFRHRGFIFGVITMALTFGTFFASVVLIPLWLQTSIGYTATWAGYASAMNGVFAVLVSPIVGRYVGKVDPRAFVSFGVCWLAGVAIWRSHFTTDVTFWNVALPFLFQGFAMPFYFVSITSITLSAVQPQETASAAGLSNFLRTASAAFATSIMTTAWENLSNAKRAQLSGRLNDAPGTVTALTDHGFTAAQAAGQIEHLLQVQATMLATNQIFQITSLLFILAGTLVWFAPRPKPGGGMGGGH
jgi:DHA2 family multidrug resistance protein